MDSGTLRTMTEADLDIVLTWRNAPDVRHFMYTTHEISKGEHKTWYEQAISNPRVSLLIFELERIPSGFINFTRGRCSEVADWGFYLAPGSQKGTGRSLGTAALNYGFHVMELHKICGQVLGFNEKSIAFHSSLGFSEEGRLRQQYYDGERFHDIVCFGLLKQEWITYFQVKSNE